MSRSKPTQKHTGRCILCGESFGKRAIANHFESCFADHARELPADGFHLLVEGGGTYWLHLAVPADLTLAKLDGFLRETWVECCGHLSQFTIDGICYSAEGDDELETRGNNLPLKKLLNPGTVFGYEYDFGTTTELRLSVVSSVSGSGKMKNVKLLARNDPPDIRCAGCGSPATQVCSECLCQGGGWLCDSCSTEHECGEEMLLPVVNSPRVGMCGYTG